MEVIQSKVADSLGNVILASFFYRFSGHFYIHKCVRKVNVVKLVENLIEIAFKPLISISHLFINLF